MNPKPKTLQEAIKYFSNEQVCIDEVAALRWPNGPVCPKCGGKEHYYLATQRRWKCKAKGCAKQFSVKVGTIFEDSAITLDKWLIALWMLVISASQIRRVVSEYLAHDNSERFAQEFAALSYNIHKNEDVEAVAMARSIEFKLALTK